MGDKIENRLMRNYAKIIPNPLDTFPTLAYICVRKYQKVVKSGGNEKCSMGSMNIASTAKGGSSSPPNSERYSKKTMWSDFLSLGVWIRVSSYSRKMNGESRRRALNPFRSRARSLGASTASTSQAPVKSPATSRGGF